MNKPPIKCLFIHDHKFKIVDDSYFSEGKMTDDVLFRYVIPPGKVQVISRLERLYSSDNLSEITIDNVTFTPIKGLKFSKAFSVHLLDNLKLITTSIRSADFLVIRSPSFLGLFSMSINTIMRKPYFVEVVGDGKEALLTSKEKPSIPFKIFVNFCNIINKYHIKHALGAIYVTKKALQEKYPTLGISEYASNVEVSIKDKKLEYSDFEVKGICKIGLIGSFNNPYKGIKEAIDSIHILHNKGYEIKLHILGSGSLESFYKKLLVKYGLENQVSFDGILPGGKAVTNWLENLNLYIQPSYTEGLPRSLIEAMSVGLPAIATNVGGIPELLDTESLIRPYDSQILAEKIEELIISQDLRYKQGVKNYTNSKNYGEEVLRIRRNNFWEKARKLVSTKY